MECHGDPSTSEELAAQAQSMNDISRRLHRVVEG